MSSNPCSPATARKHTSGSKLKRKTGTALNVAKQKTPCHATARQPGSSGSSMSAVLHGGEIQVRKTNEKLVAITAVITDLSLQPTRLNNAIDKRTATSCCRLTVRLFKGNQAFWVCDHENRSCARWSWNVIAAVRSFKFIFVFDFAKSERIWRAPEKMDRTFDLGWDPVAQKTFDKHGGTASALPEEANREYYECCGFVLKKATQVTFQRSLLCTHCTRCR